MSNIGAPSPPQSEYWGWGGGGGGCPSLPGSYTSELVMTSATNSVAIVQKWWESGYSFRMIALNPDLIHRCCRGGSRNLKGGGGSFYCCD